MSLQSLHAAPAASFDQPLAILAGCHERILRFCDMLERLTEHLQEHGVDAEASESAHSIHRYFSTAGRHHHEDEENDLFPMLLAQDDSMKRFLDELQSTHRELDNIWDRLNAILLDLGTIDWRDFQSEVARFVALNREHVELENRELLPRADALLVQAQREQLGRAMARRRGVDYLTVGNMS